MLGYLYNLATDKHKGFIPAIIKMFLFILSLVYGLIIRILIFFSKFSTRRLECKVVSVGNITLGGTGKTCLVEYIAGFLKEKGHKVAVLSRGYKRGAHSSEFIAQSSETMGDEPFMLSQKLSGVPVVVDANRARGAKSAKEDYGADTVILDDGFQQWKIIKDLEIVAVDSTNPFGNRHMLPRGILREPLSSLKRADIFVLTKVNLSEDTERIREYLSKLNPRGLPVESIHKPLEFYNLHHPDQSHDIYGLENITVTLFSGIGDHDSFEKLIKILGIKVGLSFRFRDHHDYTNEDFKKIIGGSREKNIDTVITTEKDAARIKDILYPFSDLRILVLRIGLVITKGEEQLHDRLLKLYSV